MDYATDKKSSGVEGDQMKLIGNPEISVEALKTMRERALSQDKWYAYQNHAMDSTGLGGLQFLQIGPGRTFTTPPARMPDTIHAIGWKFLLVGFVNLETGQMEETQ
jgi:hypothetical protein